MDAIATQAVSATQAVPAIEIKSEAIPSSVVSVKDCESALSVIKTKFPNTTFVSAKPSQLPGYVLLELEDGSFAYTDKSAKFLFIGVIFDTAKGLSIDNMLSGHSN